MIIQFSSVHPRTDTRIRLKETATLARHWPGQVELYVQDGRGTEVVDDGNFVIHDTGAPERGRVRRMTVGAWRMYREVCRARPKIAQFHDPELLPWAVLLQWSGIQVIYDVHEDLPAAILSKHYIHASLRGPLSKIVKLIETTLSRFLKGVVSATPTIEKNFAKLKPTLVQNYPMLSEFQGWRQEYNLDAPPHFAYVGAVNAIRGAAEMVAAVDLMQEPDVRLQMAGPVPEKLRTELEKMSGWNRVVAHGLIDREKVAKTLAGCRAGLVLFHPEPNHVRAQPNKMFEYMAAGLPVIASDFPVWREIIDNAGCGLLVDPLDPLAIADAMQWLLEHPKDAAEMGRQGRAAVEEKFNWEAESKKLVALYQNLLSTT